MPHQFLSALAVTGLLRAYSLQVEISNLDGGGLGGRSEFYAKTEHDNHVIR